MGNYSMGSGCLVAQNYTTRTTFVVFWRSPTFRSQTWKSSQPTEIHGEVPVPAVWADSVRCQIKQLQIDATASTTGAAQYQLVPDVRSAAECVLPSLACATTFVATSHVLHDAPSSTNVIVDVKQASKPTAVWYWQFDDVAMSCSGAEVQGLRVPADWKAQRVSWAPPVGYRPGLEIYHMVGLHWSVTEHFRLTSSAVVSP